MYPLVSVSHHSEDEEEPDMSRSSTDSSPSEEGYTSDTDEEPRTSSQTLSSPTSPPSFSSTKLNSGTIPQAKSTMHSYPRSSTPPLTPSSRQIRPRTLAPLSALPPPHSSGALPKSPPLSRALFARLANDTAHPALNASGKKKGGGGGPKLIVPTKGFRTRFELDLTASELARTS